MLYYDFKSKDPDRYDIVEACLPVPPSNMCNLVVSSLTTFCSFIVLDEEDYFKFKVWKTDDDVRDLVCSFGTYHDIDKESFKSIFNAALTSMVNVINVFIPTGGSRVNVNIEYSDDGRVKMVSTHKIQIVEVSYRLKLLLGMYDMILPLEIAANGTYIMKSLPYFNLTPIFYLVSNLNTSSFSVNGLTQIVMRIANTFKPENIIVENNGDYMCSVQSSSLAHLRFQLVDANLHDVKLLAPLYISITVELQPEPSFTLSPEEQEQLQLKEEELKREYMLCMQIQEELRISTEKQLKEMREKNETEDSRNIKAGKSKK